MFWLTRQAGWHRRQQSQSSGSGSCSPPLQELEKVDQERGQSEGRNFDLGGFQLLRY